MLYLTLGGAFIALIVIGAPIAVALGGATVLAACLFYPIADGVIGMKLYNNLDHFTLMAVPFFFLAASFMEHGGLVKRLIALARTLVGHLKAGLGMATVLTCIFFAAISGSSPATVAAVGNILHPALLEEGYSKHFSAGAIVTSGSIGILLPPSIPLILYGFTTETSIPALFMAGIIPGLVYGALLILTARWLAGREGVKVRQRAGAGEIRGAIKRSLPALMLPVVIVVGIYGYPSFELFGREFAGGSIFTPTEAAVVTVGLAIIIGRLVYRELRLRDIPAVIAQTVPRVGMIFWITANALLFGFFITLIGVPDALANFVAQAGVSPLVFLLCVNLLLLVVGFFLEGVPTILIFAPLLQPAAQALGIDPVHFAIIMVVNIELGLVTPPVGMNLFVASSVTGMPVLEVFRAALPWIVTTLVMLMLVTFVPSLSLTLPGLMS